MEYCSAQLSKFEMVDSEGGVEIELPEMQCLPVDLAAAIGPVKRSLLESMESAESDKKLKCNSSQSGKWGPVLSTRPVTRQHGNVKIMEKATAYIQKKNLEIPTSFQGCTWRGLGYDLAKLKGTLQQWLVLCDDAQADSLRRFILLLYKHRGELMRIAWI